ncbi:hypothetical protein BJY01DRAFT_111127 [Aspergillus pseudoustus]|uniref:Mitochondrial zinc maintenance protein 1, mitochondrial n=1 Tax=Aspergillus pseudoustus TaxID=1810923 RepID=A0ABR4ITC2_9EURO
MACPMSRLAPIIINRSKLLSKLGRRKAAGLRSKSDSNLADLKTQFPPSRREALLWCSTPNPIVERYRKILQGTRPTKAILRSSRSPIGDLLPGFGRYRQYYTSTGFSPADIEARVDSPITLSSAASPTQDHARSSISKPPVSDPTAPSDGYTTKQCPSQRWSQITGSSSRRTILRASSSARPSRTARVEDYELRPRL